MEMEGIGIKQHGYKSQESSEHYVGEERSIVVGSQQVPGDLHLPMSTLPKSTEQQARSEIVTSTSKASDIEEVLSDDDGPHVLSDKRELSTRDTITHPATGSDSAKLRHRLLERQRQLELVALSYDITDMDLTVFNQIHDYSLAHNLAYADISAVFPSSENDEEVY